MIVPRAIVFLKGTNWEYTKSALNNIYLEKNDSLIKDYGTVMEFYIESFGNPDFIASLWSTNVELLKSAILFIRKECKADTTSIIGVEPNERDLRLAEILEGIPLFNTDEDRIKQMVQMYVQQEEKIIGVLKKTFN